MVENIDPNARKLLGEALSRYDLQTCDAQFIRHNENMTFRVGDEYLLRIHKHKEGFTTDPIYEGFDCARIHELELAFINHLKACGMRVQTPIPNLDGKLVSILSDDTPASVLTWLPGHIIDKSELLPALCRQIGEMIAQLHSASRSFPRIPALRYDSAMCARLKSKLSEIARLGAFDDDSRRTMAAALDATADLLHKTEKDFILIHSDLSLSNILIIASGVAPIDFSLFGYCHPMMDISAIFGCIGGGANRRAIEAGYTAAGGEIDVRALDCTYALNVLLGIILHCESWTKEDWFAKKLSGWCENIFVPLVQGKSVIDYTYTACRAVSASAEKRMAPQEQACT